MSKMAKTAREAMKKKAAAMASSKSAGKVDSSTFKAYPDMNTDKQTGAKPKPRAYKSGGKVEGEKAKMRADKAPRKGKLSGGALGKYAQAAANEVNWRSNESGKAKAKADQTRLLSDRIKADDSERKAAKRTRGLEMAISKLSGSRPIMGNSAKVLASRDEPMKKGGRIKKQVGGSGSVLPEDDDYKRKLEAAGKGQSPDAKKQRDEMRDMLNDPKARRNDGEHMFDAPKRKAGGRTKKLSGGTIGSYAKKAAMDLDDSSAKAASLSTRARIADEDRGDYDMAEALERKATKVGNRANRRGKGLSMAIDKLSGSAKIPARKSGGRIAKMDGGGMDPRLNVVPTTRMKFAGSAQGTPYKKGGEVHKDEAADKALIKKMVKPEARVKKYSGGALSGDKKSSKGKGKGKTNINIVISAGGKDQQQPQMPAMPPMPPAPPMGGAPGGMPPMPPMGGAAPGAFKKGGRVAKQIGGGLGALRPTTGRPMAGGMGRPAMGGMGMPPQAVMPGGGTQVSTQPPRGFPGPGAFPPPQNVSGPAMGGMGRPATGLGPMGGGQMVQPGFGGAQTVGGPAMGQPSMGGIGAAMNDPRIAGAIGQALAGQNAPAVMPNQSQSQAIAALGQMMGGQKAPAVMPQRGPAMNLGSMAGPGGGRPAMGGMQGLGQALGGLPMRKAGGRVNKKAYKSYQDMDAGAGSGEGRLEKTEIQKSKRGR